MKSDDYALESYRYAPVFEEDEARTFGQIILKNGLFTRREEALAKENNDGKGPIYFLTLVIQEAPK